MADLIQVQCVETFIQLHELKIQDTFSAFVKLGKVSCIFNYTYILHVFMG